MIPNISAILTNISGPICEEISERNINYKLQEISLKSKDKKS